MTIVTQKIEDEEVDMRLADFKIFWMNITPRPTLPLLCPTIITTRSAENKRGSFYPVGVLVFLGLPSHLWFKRSLTASPSSQPPITHHFGCDTEGRYPPLSCPEVLVELREWRAVGLFITILKNGRMASLQEQMALHAWHHFLRQTRTRAVNTGICLL